MGAAHRSAPDALFALSCLVVVLLAVPSELIVAPLGAAGTPAQILGIAMLFWWLVSRLAPRTAAEGIGPIKWLLLGLTTAVVLSYIRGTGQPLSMVEKNSADRAMLSLAAWCGIALGVADGVATRERLDRLLRLLSGGTVAIAVLGMVQFFFGIDIAHLFSIPGLSTNHSFGSLVQRSDFRRVSGTTIHPIEFGVVLSMVLPLVVHYAIRSRGGRRWLWWASAGIVAFALPMSVARTAILGGAVAVAVAFWSWSHSVKIKVTILAVPGLLALSLVVPGLLGTVARLFVNASTDPSTVGRLEDYGTVWYYVTQAPWTGHGIGTFIPSLYRTLDNQYLGTLVETGVLGLVALIALLVGAIVTALVLRERTTVSAERDLALTLVASLAVPFVAFVTFDGLAFPMCAGITFLLVGAVGALWRIEHEDRVEEVVIHPARHWLPRSVLVLGAVLAVLVPYLSSVSSGSVHYEAYATVLVDVPRTTAGNPYLRVGSVDRAASILQSDLVGPAVRADLDTRHPGAQYGVSVGYGSLERGSDVITSSSQLRMRAVADTPAAAEALRASMLSTATTELARLQAEVGVRDPRLLLELRTLSRPAVAVEQGSSERARAGGLLLLVMFAGAAAAATSRSIRIPAHRTTAGDQAPSMRRAGPPVPSAGTAQTSVTAASTPERGRP